MRSKRRRGPIGGEVARGAALVAVVVLTAVGCGSDDDAITLPPCAAGLPVPASLEVVEVTTPLPENPTCAITLASDDPIDDVAAAWQRELDEAGIAYAVQHDEGRQAILQLQGPRCGSILVFAAGTPRIADAVRADRTPSIVSVTECAKGTALLLPSATFVPYRPH